MISVLRFALVGVLCLAPVGTACAQFNPFAVVAVEYYPDRVATPYDFQVWFTSIIDNDAVTIEAPDGTIFDTVPKYGAIYYDLHNLTATDLNRFIGSWTINDSQALPSGVAPQKHTFNVSQRDLTRPPSMPHIISPSDGAVLPPVFDVKMSHGGLSLLGPGGSASLKVLSRSPGAGTYQYLFPPDVTEVEIEARASHQVIDIGGATYPEQANRRFGVWMISNISSPPSTFTVRVPEPAALPMGFITLLGLAALRRRK